MVQDSIRARRCKFDHKVDAKETQTPADAWARLVQDDKAREMPGAKATYSTFIDLLLQSTIDHADNWLY